MAANRQTLPTILVGAFDRHNLGDLIFPHVAARLLGSDYLIFAGLVECDLRGAGGYRTQSISQLSREYRGRQLNILHVGGELLTCDAWQAAVMVQAPEQAQSLIQHLESDAARREPWVSGVLGVSDKVPYMVGRKQFPGAVNVIFNAVGGVELSERNESFRAEVITKLRSADYVSVREGQTWGELHDLGIGSRLVPDPAVMVAELFGDHIGKCTREGEVSAIQGAFPRGYFAFQFSADFGDDETLREMADQLNNLIASTGCGIVLFRAGAAPWHDDQECYRRLTGFMKTKQIRIFNSLNIWDICALIAHSRAFCGSSLHGRIVAMAFGVPRVNLKHPCKEHRTGKQRAYSVTWELTEVPKTVDITGVASGVCEAIACDAGKLHIHSQRLATKYREEFTAIRDLLGQ